MYHYFSENNTRINKIVCFEFKYMQRKTCRYVYTNKTKCTLDQFNGNYKFTFKIKKHLENISEIGKMKLIRMLLEIYV